MRQSAYPAIAASLCWALHSAAQNVPPPGQWTVIAHGRTGSCDSPANYNALVSETGWMRQLGARIEGLSPGGVNVYRMDWASLALTALNAGGTNPVDPSRHHVVLFDWGATSDFDPILCQAPTGNQNGFAYAAGDAMVALLHSWDAEDQVFALIGFSRGGVVVSEAARRLMAASTNPAQVIFIDGEGCAAGGSNGCTFYQDGRFDAWAALSGAVRFDNLYETMNERYLAPSFCSTDLGGHAKARCGNINVATAYAHTVSGSSCISYSQPSILTYVINGLSFSGGWFILPQSPGAVQDPNPPQPGSDPIETPFNGGLGFASIAGWHGHGGGGSATVSSLGGVPTLRFTRGQTRTHNFFIVPDCGASLSFRAAAEGTTPGDSALRVFVQVPGTTETLLGSISLTQLPASVGTPTTLPFPLNVQGKTARIRFSVEGTTGSSAAHIAAVGVTPCPAACYANCDGSTSSPRLTANDFQCFLNRFAAGDPYANCDQSTSSPSLTSNDFQCFLNAFAAGCS